MPSKRTTTPPTRRFALVTATLAAAYGLTACQVASPITTDLPYDPAEGVSVQTERMELLDLVIISEGEDTPGVISGYVVNLSDEPLSVDLALEVDGGRTPLSPSVEVAADSGTRLDGKTEEGEFVDPVQADSIPGLAGGLVTVRVSTSNGNTVSTRVPVFPPDGIYQPYAELIGSSSETR